jgi:hypothetical protein
MHNGFIAEFASVKRDLVMAVDESLYPEIAGQADTERMWTFRCSSDSEPIGVLPGAWNEVPESSHGSSAKARTRSIDSRSSRQPRQITVSP